MSVLFNIEFGDDEDSGFFTCLVKLSYNLQGYL